MVSCETTEKLLSVSGFFTYTQYRGKYQKLYSSEDIAIQVFQSHSNNGKNRNWHQFHCLSWAVEEGSKYIPWDDQEFFSVCSFARWLNSTHSKKDNCGVTQGDRHRKDTKTAKGMIGKNICITSRQLQTHADPTEMAVAPSRFPPEKDQ